jgi:hypothetical protein
MGDRTQERKSFLRRHVALAALIVVAVVFVGMGHQFQHDNNKQRLYVVVAVIGLILLVRVVGGVAARALRRQESAPDPSWEPARRPRQARRSGR